MNNIRVTKSICDEKMSGSHVLSENPWAKTDHFRRWERWSNEKSKTCASFHREVLVLVDHKLGFEFDCSKIVSCSNRFLREFSIENFCFFLFVRFFSLNSAEDEDSEIPWKTFVTRRRAHRLCFLLINARLSFSLCCQNFVLNFFLDDRS